MLSSVLTSERAVNVNIAIIRTFVRLRQILATHEELARQLDELRWRQDEHGQQISAIFETIEKLIETPQPDPKRRIGFLTSSGEEPEELQ
jgi:anaerobic ribonucleoside-triphosphate reductase